MAIWYFECMDAMACPLSKNTYVVGPHKGCENKPAGCMPAFYVFFIINFLQIVWAILKRWGFGCNSKPGGQSAPVAEQTGAESARAVSRRNKAGDDTTPELSETHKWSGLKRLLKRHSRPTELLKLIVAKHSIKPELRKRLAYILLKCSSEMRTLSKKRGE